MKVIKKNIKLQLNISKNMPARPKKHRDMGCDFIELVSPNFYALFYKVGILWFIIGNIICYIFEVVRIPEVDISMCVYSRDVDRLSTFNSGKTVKSKTKNWLVRTCYLICI